jgi:hypothetical protein
VEDVSVPKEIIILTNGEFTVNWGDDIIENFPGTYFLTLSHSYESTGEYEVNIVASNADCRFSLFSCSNTQLSNLNLSNCTDLTNLSCHSNQLTNLDLTGCTALSRLMCADNQLTNLNVSVCTALTSLICSHNQMANLDLSTCSSLMHLDCSNNILTDLDLSNDNIVIYYLACNNNKFQLSGLYAIQLITNGCSYNFGSQYLSATLKNLETELFADQSVFGGIFTKYTVEINGESAPENAYSVTDGKLTFHMLGKYTVTMTNNVFTSSDDPTKVIVEIDVVPVGILENEELNISVYPNPTTGELHVTCDNRDALQVTNIEIFDMYGKKQSHGSRVTGHEINISHLPAGIYFVKITTKLGEIVKKVVKY